MAAPAAERKGVRLDMRPYCSLPHLGRAHDLTRDTSAERTGDYGIRSAMLGLIPVCWQCIDVTHVIVAWF